MKQIRKGKYTKRISPWSHIKHGIKGRITWFRKLSRPKKIAVIAAPILAFLIIVPIATYLYYAHDISDQERLMNRNNTGVVFTDKNGKVFYSVGKAQHRELVPLSEIADDMKNALLASEDKDFYNHGGFSIIGFARAAITGVGGGSTLTQQLAKNTLLSDKHSYLRKYQELAVSVAIEQQYTKDQILDMYLNSVYYGENAFGIEDAAKTYFNKKPADLTLAESAMLVGVLPAPSAYSPISGNAEYAKSRQTTVLDRMVATGYITEAEKVAALKVKLKYAKQSGQLSDAPHFVEMVMEELDTKYGREQVMRSGYQVKTTLDVDLQAKLTKNLTEHMDFIRSNGGSNASGIAIDPRTGEVRALVGSADYTNEKWGMVNMVTTSRQPGSTFKTIYYSKALAEGVITPATVYADEPINIGGWQPHNADLKWHGNVTVRSAISRSLNIPSIKVMQDYGVERSVQAAKDFGITTLDDNKDYGLALAIGSAEAPLIQMTNAYASLANAGERYDTSIITQIENKFGQKIYQSNKQAKRSISQAGAFLMSNILSDNAARAPTFGSALTLNGHTAAVKTGTTDESRDAWTIGYTPSLAVGVWVGNNNNDTMLYGGSDMAGPIWRGTMNDALAGTSNEQFAVPSGVVQKATCYSNHGIATNSIADGTYREYYLASALPSKTCTPEKPKPIQVCNLADKKIETIEEKDFDSKKYSKDLDKCKVEPETMEVCELATGQVITINKDAFDETKYSTDTTNCTPPDDEDDGTGMPTLPLTP